MDDHNRGREEKERAREQLELYAEANDLGIVFKWEGFLGIALKNMLLNKDGHGERLLHMFSQHHMLVSAGPVVACHDEIRHSFEEARRMLKNPFYYSNGDSPIMGIPQLFCSTHPEGVETSGNEREELDKIRQRVISYIEAGNLRPAAEWMDQSARMMYHERMEESQIKAWYAELVKEAKRLNERLECSAFTLDVTDIYKHSSFIGMHKMVKSALCVLCQSRIDNHEQALPRLLDYIHRHYNEPLRLETLAELFHYNSSYLGKLFKKQTGEGFNSYLDKVRIGYAKQFLKQGQKVHQVAKDVGYPNPDYFHAKFKRYVGQSPSTYRGSSSSQN